MYDENSQRLETIDEALYYLSDNVNKVSNDINNINAQVDDFHAQMSDVKSNVQNLETEIRTFMKEMKQNALVNNAKQTIMLSQMEYEKKYKHRDEVRRRTLGLLQSIDINLIKKSTMETISEETIVNNPDYWLAPALVALCHWHIDNKELATLALKKALDRSVEKTSLLFCLIHLRASRTNAAKKWLIQYFSNQDPTNMDCKIILILDALCSGVFNQEITNIITKQITSWQNQLNALGGYSNHQVDSWVKYFKEQEEYTVNDNKYIKKFVQEHQDIDDIIHYSKFQNSMIKQFEDELKQSEIEKGNHQNKIDELINLLIFDYETEELNLKMEIQKNNSIINSTKEEEPEYHQNYYIKTDFYTHLSNICLSNVDFNLGENTSKMAMCLLKDYIKEAYQKNNKNTNELEIINLSIIIDDWMGTTTNGSNELELKNNLTKHIDNQNTIELQKYSLLNTKMILSIILGIPVMIISHKYSYLIIITILFLIIFNGYHLYKNYQIRNNKQKELEAIKNNKIAILMCTISEIVDYYFEYKENDDKMDEFTKYLDSLEYSKYIKTYNENKRNIFIGGK